MSRDVNGHNVYVNLGASNHTAHERSANDFYATPPLAVRHLLEVEKFSRDVWEPACGMNHIADILSENGYSVRRSDIVKMVDDPGIEIIDFLEYDGKWHGDIVTNPPFRHANEFVRKALDVVDEGARVAMFLKIQFLEGVRRYGIFRDDPPKTIYVASQRYGCSETGEFNADGNAVSAICYCWYVWQKGFRGDPVVKWINVKEP